MSGPEGDGRIASRRRFLGAFAALAAIGLAWWSDHLVRWLALAVALTIVPDLVGELRRRGGLARWTRWAPHAVLVVVAAWCLHELVLGHPPATRDHGIHYFQARILVDDMLPRLSGWNDRINHGYPYGEGYPTLGYLWVSAIHLVSGGVVDLRTSYAWGLLAVWVLTLWAVWHVAAMVFDDVVGESDPRGRSWAGCIGALAWLLDPGESRQGGWEYLMFHGVWPQALSAALWVASIVLVRRALLRPTPRVLALAALAAAGSLLAHPFGLLTIAGSLVGWLVVLAVAADARTLPVGRLRIVAIVHALALALAAGGLATFLTAAGEMGRTPVGWMPLGELVAKFAIGDLFGGPWGWIGVLAVVGLALALWCGRSFAWLIGGLVVGMLLLASHESLTVLRLDLVTSAFKNLQFSRYAIAIKPLAFALVGPAAVLAVRGLVRLLQREPNAPPSWTRRIFLAVLLAPVLATLLGRVDALLPRPIAGIDTLETSEHGEIERSLRAALVAEREAIGPLRVAFLRSKMGGGMFPLFAIADAGAAVVLDGHVPTVNFVHTVEERSPFVLARLGVTHVIHDRPIDDEPLLVAALANVGTHGPYTLARFTTPAVPFAELDDSGTVEIVEQTSDRVVFDVAPQGPTRLVLAWAPSERWAWSVDGEPREATSAIVRGGGLELLAVDVDRPGRVELQYVRHERERIAAWVSWAALVLAGLGLVLARPLAFAERLHSPTALTISRGLAATSIAIVLALVVRRQHAQLAATWDEYATEATRDAVKDPIPPFLGDLTIEDSIAITRTPARICDGLLGKDPLSGCHESEGGPFEAIAYVEPYLYRCTQFSVVAGGHAEIELGDAGDEVLALLVRRGDQRGRHLRYDAPGIADKALVGRAELRLRPGDAPARIVVTNEGDDTERVCVAAARFGT